MASNHSIALRFVQDVSDELLNQFSCGRHQLDGFLKEDAKKYQELGLTTTAVAFLEGENTVIGYFSLSADTVQLKTSEQFALGLGFDFPIKFFPAAKITKLAVSQDLQKQNIGSQLIDLICGLANPDHIAIRLLTVDAVNEPEVISFYENRGFIPSLAEEGERKDQDRETILMFKDLYAEE